ncbi:protein Niban 2a [Pseudoliparis swirei]|uniref:protein Niban 2a n=1 Tax=Pseudoliparis swirei TaxID=2059687 RepID=UPI0024BEA3B9|nr:protein Niban 2a [Pseudoliparis swirei]
MGDVVSSHLDEGRREVITARTRGVMKEFGVVYEQQYAVALFNSVRFEIEGGGGPQSQLLHRKDPLAGRSIFSGSLFQYLEENRKWRNRFVSVPDSYTISLYEGKTAHDRGLHAKGTINCAGYKALTSMEDYMELINSSLPDVKAKAGSNPFIKCATQFPLILWHPYARHHYFCVTTEKEQSKWHAVLQDCVRHSNNGLSEDCTVQTPAFTDSVRLHRQAKGHYGTWDMMCGAPPQILANLVMESLHPELRSVIAPLLRGKLQQRQKHWMLISDALYRQVLSQTTSQYGALAEACEAQRAPLDSVLRTDMDQIVSSKEHVSSKMRALVLPKAEQLLRGNVQPYIGSILEALMEPSSRGFAEVREVFFRELVEVSRSSLNGGGRDALGDHMEKLSMLAFHPVKMQSCYEKVEQLNLEGLQQRFAVASPSVFVSRAQTLMGQQMDNAVYTFEQLLNQSLETQKDDDICKTMQRCQDRVLKKYDYDSSTVRKKFFRESLLQIIIPYMLQQLSPSCSPELPRFKELIFEDFSRFLLVENLFEEVVLQCVSKDIMMAVKEAAVQRRHNLYRDSIILTSSDANLHLLEESPQVDWANKFGADDPEGDGGGSEGGLSSSRRRQVVSMISLDGIPLSFESCLEVPGVEIIPEEAGEASEGAEAAADPGSPDCVTGIRDLINPTVNLTPLPASEESDGTDGGTEASEDGERAVEDVHRETEEADEEEEEHREEAAAVKNAIEEHREEEAAVKNAIEEHREEEAAVKNAIEEIEMAAQEDDGERMGEAAESECERSAAAASDSSSRSDSGFQSPASVGPEEGEEPRPITNGLDAEDKAIDPPAGVEAVVA